MGTFTFAVNPQFVRMMQQMADIDEIAPKMLSGAAVILARNIGIALSAHTRTEELLKSFRMEKPQNNKWGWYIFIKPTGVSKTYKNTKGEIKGRKVPIRNAEIMAYLEYGTKNQPPRPILTKALNDSHEAVENKMQEIFEQEVLNGR